VDSFYFVTIKSITIVWQQWGSWGSNSFTYIRSLWKTWPIFLNFKLHILSKSNHKFTVFYLLIKFQYNNKLKTLKYLLNFPSWLWDHYIHGPCMVNSVYIRVRNLRKQGLRYSWPNLLRPNGTLMSSWDDVLSYS